MEGARQYLLLVFHESFHALVLQFAHDAGPHVHHLLVQIGHAFSVQPLPDSAFHVVIKESHEQFLGFLERENLQFVGVFYIHNLVANVVGRLHEVDQWVACTAQGLARGGQADDAQLLGNPAVSGFFRAEESEFAVVSRHAAGKGILHDGGQRGIGHDKAAGSPAGKLVGEQAKSIGIALEMRDVVPESLAHLAAQTAALVFGEIGLDGLFARVPEGRVAHVVGQSGRLHDGANLLEQRAPQFGVPLDEPRGHVVAQRLAQRRHLQGVCQPVVHKHAARQREHLGLVLQPPERGRIDEPVAVALELGAVVMAQRMRVFLSEPPVGDELFPVHVVVFLVSFYLVV